MPRGLEYWALRARGLVRRAANVNKDFPISIAVPAGTTCSGTVAGQQNVCFMKIANGKLAVSIPTTESRPVLIERS